MSSFELENELFQNGFKFIAGIDEAGRGPFAGPVVAACVILPLGIEIQGLDDSKKIKSEAKRQKLYDEIIQKAVCYSISSVSNDEIDEINILNATFKAMRNSVLAMKIKPDFLLIDGNISRGFDDFQNRAVTKGDSISTSISAASILAKVTRDNFMNEQAEKYPQYDFAQNKGYGSAKKHIQGLLDFGPCPIHRRTFLRKFCEKYNLNW